ncbi:MAG: S8 family serine peptidase [Chloroflexi bacterium]|nr:S8 family serine peptidase [Chloroflexota bacterium]
MKHKKRWWFPAEMLGLVLFFAFVVTAQSYEPLPPTTPTAVANTRTYLITLSAPSLVTRQAQTGSINLNTPDGQQYRQTLLQQQDSLLAELSKEVQRPLTARYHYTLALNALAIDLTPEEATAAAANPAISAISPSQNHQPLTDAGPAWIGAPSLWDGSQTGTPGGTMGEGIIVGIIDTGINIDHPSFAAVGGDGYTHINPLGAGNYLGACAAQPATFVCNDKLIGAYSWPESGDNPEDNWGHGSNVAAIAAGNVITLPYAAPTLTLTPTLSGVAPHATLIAYDVCSATTCPDYLGILAIEQAILDGADVLNYSIGGTAVDPWNDPLALAFLAAREAGIFVATAAGNNGPNPGTINSPGNVPWMTTAGNATGPARFDNTLANLSGGATTPPPSLTGSSVAGAHGPAPIVRALGVTNTNGVPDNGRCAVAFPPNTWTNGEIVYCSTGTVNSTSKANNVLAGGAGGVVIDSGQTLAQRLGIERLPLPGMNLLSGDAAALAGWLASGSGHTATISGTIRTVNPAYGDELYFGSSRGPNAIITDVLKPNVAAPGTKIWSAGMTTNPANPPELSFYTGTSQASPHVAGTAALLRALHPDWTPAEVESALMMTAVSPIPLPGGTSPAGAFDQGAGRIDLTAVARAGLLLNETAVNFRAANPALGGSANSLNLAALVNGACPQTCTWTRQFRSALATESTWSATITQPVTATVQVTPTIFTLPPGGVQTITITGSIGDLPANVWDFGSVLLESDDPLVPGAHLPLAMRHVDFKLVSEMLIYTRRDAGSQLLPDLQASHILTLTASSYRLTPGTMYTLSIPVGEAITVTTPVSTNNRRLTAEIVQSTAINVDFTMQKIGGSVVCNETGQWWNESCDVLDPAAGMYEIVVTSVKSALSEDEVVLVTAVVPNTTSSNNWLTGPLGEPIGGPFDLRYFWNEPAMDSGEYWYGGFDLGTQPANPRDVAFIPVNLVRLADDVNRTVSPTVTLMNRPLTTTLTILPNVTPVAMAYVITETIPAGLAVTHVNVTAGLFTQTNDYLRWEVSVPRLGAQTAMLTYQATADLAACNTTLIGTLSNTTDALGSLPASKTWSLPIICYQIHMPAVIR